MVDSTNLPNVDINQIATDLNGKIDRDCLNASDTGNIQMGRASMPSNRYIDLTLGASKATYTAPADGWYVFAKVIGTANRLNSLQNLTSGVQTDFSSPDTGYWGRVYVPCKKGDTIRVEYSSTGALKVFRFIYAVGSESEAS